MLIDEISLSSNKIYDVVIIGSGAAGLTLALKLEEKKFNIALIEAGERYYSGVSE